MTGAAARRAASFRNDVARLLEGRLQHGGVPRQLRAARGDSGSASGAMIRPSITVDHPRGSGPPHQPRPPERSLICSSRRARFPTKGASDSPPIRPRPRVLREWIAAGRADDVGSAPRLKSLRVLPGERDLRLAPSYRSSSWSRPSSPTVPAATSLGRPRSTSATRPGRSVPDGTGQGHPAQR